MIELHEGIPYLFRGELDFVQGLTSLARHASNDGPQEYVSLPFPVSYENLEALRDTLSSGFEFGILFEENARYLIRGSERSIGNGFANRTNGSIFLHSHPNQTPPSMPDIATAGRLSRSQHSIITNEGIYAYTGLFTTSEIPFEVIEDITEEDLMSYCIKTHYKDLISAKENGDSAFWQAFFRAVRDCGGKIDLYRWGQEAREYWKSIIAQKVPLTNGS